MKISILVALLFVTAGVALADGPVIQTTPYTRNLLYATNSSDAQTRLGFTGTNITAVTSNTISSIAQIALTPFTNSMEYAVVASTNANYGLVDIRQWGAKVDGTVYNGCYCSNGATLYSAAGNFNSAMVGLYCYMRLAGTNGAQDFLTTVSAYVSPNVLTLSSAPVVQTFNLPVCIGHDDSSAWQAAFNYYGSVVASVTYLVPLNPATTNTYGISMICTNFTDIGDWRSHWNSQLHAPNIPFSASSVSPVWTFLGATKQVGGTVHLYTGQWNPSGSIILCCQPYGADGSNWINNFNFCAEGGGNGGTFGVQHLYGWNNLGVQVQDIKIQGALNDDCKLWNVTGCTTSGGEDSYIWGGYSQFDLNNIPCPANTNTAGVLCSQEFADQPDRWKGMTITYFYTAVYAGENMDFNGVRIFGCTNAFDFLNSGGNLMKIDGVNQFGDVKNIFTDANLNIDLEADGLNVQETGLAFTNWCLLNDPGNFFCGSIVYCNTAWNMSSGTNAGSIVGGSGCTVHPFVALSSGNIPVLTPSIAINGSLTGGVDQPNAEKIWTLSAANYSHGYPGPREDLIDYDTGGGAGFATMSIGGPFSGSRDAALFGVQYLRFYTSANDSTTASEKMLIDNSGNVTFAETGGTTTADGNLVSEGNLVGGGTLVVSNNMTGNASLLISNNITANGSMFASNNITADGSITSSNVLTSSGFGSTATNVLFFTHMGITNYLPVNVQLFLWNDADTGTYFTNFNSHMGFKMGNLGADENFILQPGDAIVSPGNGFFCYTNRAL